METNEELTDIIEMHFIEIPKLSNESDERDKLMAWTEFLRDPESEKVRSLEMSIRDNLRTQFLPYHCCCIFCRQILHSYLYCVPSTPPSSS